MSAKVVVLTIAVLAIWFLSGCEQKMATKGRFKPLERSAFFADQQSARQLVPGTVPREGFNPDPAFTTGKVNGEFVTELPVKLTPQLLQRGQERFNIFCAHCHGRDGYGGGIIVRHGFTRPPSYHTPELRQKPIGHFYDVITNGYGAMFSHADRVEPGDRWAIAAYIRALQLSQYSNSAQLSPEAQAQLTENGR